MLCAIYRSTAYVTWLYDSTESNQPRVFHGNTCAHDVNVFSTASKLPITPDDVTGLISVVFICPGKYSKECLKQIFHVQKHKIWAFILWLKEHNYLYKDITLSKENSNCYPDSDAIPGIQHRVIHEKDIDIAKLLAEETAGIDDHPALQVLQSSNENEITVFLEKMGVSDPEQVKI